MVLICFFLFQAKQVVHPNSISKDFEIVDCAEANVGSHIGIKGREEVSVS